MRVFFFYDSFCLSDYLSTQSVRTVSYNLANAKVDDFVGVVQAYIYIQDHNLLVTDSCCDNA
jgi:hypothetical protein